MSNQSEQAFYATIVLVYTYMVDCNILQTTYLLNIPRQFQCGKHLGVREFMKSNLWCSSLFH